MPLFFFDVHDDIVACDEDGVELPDAEAARHEALRGARALACEQVLTGRLDIRHRIEIRDGGGTVIGTVSFRDAIAVAG